MNLRIGKRWRTRSLRGFSRVLLQSLCCFLVCAAFTEMPSWAQGDHGFRFVRIKYDVGSSRFGGWRGGAPWAHDYPAAEINFHEAVSRTTKIHVEGEPIVLTLEDERIFQYPVLYLCEPGYWEMSDEAVENLSNYLRRGGFILFDDFRGQFELMNTYEQMQRVLPNIDPIPLPPEHPIWTIYYDVDPVAAPSLVSQCRAHCEDTYYGYFDEQGRLVGLMNHNQDIGDGWEWPERDFENASTVSFQMGVNFLIYALTH